MKELCYGASLSIKQCRNFGIEPTDVLRVAIHDLGLKRFRLMSFWDEHEQQAGHYDFKELDKQINFIQKSGGEVTLCLGARQPRWPESHWPDWTTSLSKFQRYTVLIKFIETVVKRYNDNSVIVSWQLENEALLKNFGQNGDFDRKRLRSEFALVKKLDPTRPIIMTTSTSWGIPLRQPIPDVIGFSYYRVTYDKGSYRYSLFQPWIFKLRAFLIKLIWQRPSFIHELQAEPWGPKNIWEMNSLQQDISMSPELLAQNIQKAKATGLYPIDFWGLEWWFCLRKKHQTEILATVKKNIAT